MSLVDQATYIPRCIGMEVWQNKVLLCNLVCRLGGCQFEEVQGFINICEKLKTIIVACSSITCKTFSLFFEDLKLADLKEEKNKIVSVICYCTVWFIRWLILLCNSWLTQYRKHSNKHYWFHFLFSISLRFQYFFSTVTTMICQCIYGINHPID